MTNIAVLVSGGGTDLQSIIDGVNAGNIDGKIKLVISSKHGVYAETRADNNGIPYKVLAKSDFNSKEELYSAMINLLREYETELVVLAGYINILPPAVINEYRGRIINIHPSLIPRHCGKGYYGLKVHESVIASGDKKTGLTIHYVDEGADTGEIIYREEVDVLDGDTPEKLQKRVLEREHVALPMIVARLCREINEKRNYKMRKTALISVSDKTGITDAAKRLEKMGYDIVSTGGTYKILKENGVNVINISDVTGFPECLDGRVKTLHPRIHAGILAMRDNAEHMSRLQELEINTVDVVIVNLYPFKNTIMKPDCTFAEAVENIDIGGPSMLRAAAKNYQDVTVLIDPADYEKAFEELESGKKDIEFRKYLMFKVFSHTAAYDSMISNYLRTDLGIEYPEVMTMAYERAEELRYGENPHQSGALYKEIISDKNALVNAVQLNGKQLSYNNLNDANGALELLREFSEPTVVAVKHANPCGVSQGTDIYDAYTKAYNSDPVSIFGGIVALNRTVDAQTAKAMSEIFLEIIIAPDYTEEALEILRTKVNLRVLKLEEIMKGASVREYKRVNGGLIVQSIDNKLVEEYKTVSEKAPTEEQIKDMEFGLKVVKHCKSNAIVVVKNGTTLGLGIGQTNRIWATKQAIEHAVNGVEGAVLVSDAFFPFNDCVEEAAKHGIAAVAHPGGSKRDQDSVDSANAHGMAMVMTGIRHFKH